MGTGFITRERQTVVELARRDCLARLTTVDREIIETKPLSHVHSRQLHVEIGSTVSLEVVATYPYHAHILTTANQPVVFSSRKLYPVENVSAITRNMIGDSVVGDPQSLPAGPSTVYIITVLALTTNSPLSMPSSENRSIRLAFGIECAMSRGRTLEEH